MRKILLTSAIVLPLAGCSLITNWSVFQAYEDWCQGNWGDVWYCEVDHARDGRHDLLGDPSDRNGRDSREDRESESPSNGSSESNGEGESSDKGEGESHDY